jgi:hypothetical protein
MGILLPAITLGLGWAGLRLTAGYAEEEYPYADGGGGGVEGDPCTATTDCTMGYVCAGSGTCQRMGAPGTQNEGDGCAYNTDCLVDLVCASYGQCAKPGAAGEGDNCTGNETCSAGLLCSSQRICSKPGSPGTIGPNEACEAADDCAFGLVCVEQICTPLTFWAGVTCEKDTGPIRAFFEIPRSSKPVTEFYRLPFPNDIRFKNGHVDLSGHPNPGTALPAEYGDIVDSYFTGIEQDVTGFGLNTAVFMRVSQSFNLNTIKLDFLDIDVDSPGYAKGVAYSMWASTGRGKYICENQVVIRPAAGRPLLAETTYAVLLRKGILDNDGNPVVQDDDFKLMLQASAPADAEVKAAWQAYQPLRDYLTDQALDPSEVLSAAVFTTMNPRARMAAFRDVILNQAQSPAPAQLTLCDGAATSPCAGTEATHVCPTATDSAFHEIQGIYQTPVFQSGTPPYKALSDGGAILYDSNTQPIIQRHEKACFAMTVPKGATMPAEGWPVVIFAHGTGGSYRSFINNGTAAALAHVKDDLGATVSQMVVIGIDGSMHGPRRGSTDSPDELFFNLRNPKAARDNTYQGAADKFQLVRMISGVDWDNTQSPTGEAIKLDPSRIYFFGHSQGTIEGIPFLAFEPDVKGTVLSGAGGYLIGSLLAKTKPVNVAGLVKLALADGQVGTSHPLLNLLQLYFEEVDTINYGKAMFNKPEESVGAKHTLLSYGVADSFTPPGTIDSLGWAMGIRQVNQSAQRCGDGVCNGNESCATCEEDCKKCPDGTTCGDGNCDKTKAERCSVCPEDCGACPPLYALDDPPVSGNVQNNSEDFTAAMVQYVSDGTYDDHFVAFDNPDGKTQTTHFLGTAARDGIPTIPKVD